MTIYVANPIYDSVFKYLMEDERIARTLLSALLKKEVLHVEQRPHEYSNVTKGEISMLRIDFAATVLESDGSQRLILIELQKTWLETETLRFRQYLGAQYSRKSNIVSDSGGRYALPMVAVYLLGHRVGDIEEPVLYVDHKSVDYNGVEVTKGLPDPFVESLTHNSILVQIPLLPGRINSRLSRVLAVFDQTRASEQDRHIIAIDDSCYEGDADMQYLLHRLNSAASNPDIRQDMNVEDEYFQAIEDRDTAIMKRDKRIAEQESKISEQESRITEQAGKITEQAGKITEQADKITEQAGKITEQEERIRSLKGLVQGLLSGGMTIEQIAQMTGQTPEEIRSLL